MGMGGFQDYRRSMTGFLSLNPAKAADAPTISWA